MIQLLHICKLQNVPKSCTDMFVVSVFHSLTCYVSVVLVTDRAEKENHCSCHWQDASDLTGEHHLCTRETGSKGGHWGLQNLFVCFEHTAPAVQTHHV